jgi:hypothetical protein
MCSVPHRFSLFCGSRKNADVMEVQSRYGSVTLEDRKDGVYLAIFHLHRDFVWIGRSCSLTDQWPKGFDQPLSKRFYKFYCTISVMDSLKPLSWLDAVTCRWTYVTWMPRVIDSQQFACCDPSVIFQKSYSRCNKKKASLFISNVFLQLCTF